MSCREFLNGHDYCLLLSFPAVNAGVFLASSTKIVYGMFALLFATKRVREGDS